MSSRHCAAEGRIEVAVTHLAMARRQNCRKRHFGFFTKDVYLRYIRLFLQKILQNTQDDIQKISHKSTKDSIQMIIHQYTNERSCFFGSFFLS